MKNLLYPIALLLLLLCFSSCLKTLCKDVDCGAHGYCNLGECVCDAGWDYDSYGNCTDSLECYNVDCGHGYCNASVGGCVCDLGWEIGTDGKCSRLWREQFLGNWQGSHITGAGDTVGPYTMTVVPTATETNQVQIQNFLNYSCSFTGTTLRVNASANAIGTHAYLATFQSTCTGISSIAGSWDRIDDTLISIDISVVIGSTIVNCQGVFQKI